MCCKLTTSDDGIKEREQNLDTRVNRKVYAKDLKDLLLMRGKELLEMKNVSDL